MSKSLLVVSDYLPSNVSWELPDPYIPWLTALGNDIPDQGSLREYDVVLVLGQLSREASAIQFGGALRLAVESGLTAILLYPTSVEGPDRRLVEQLFPGISGIANYGQEWTVVAATPAFHEFFAVYGRSKTVVSQPSEESEVLGRVEGDPCAWAVRQGKGQAYLLPFRAADIASNPSGVVRELLKAVESFSQDGASEETPDFLVSVRLPGEEEALSRIDEKEIELEQLRAEAQRLQRYRHLIGTATGAGLESLILEALNVILEGTEVRAEDREDVGAEDFWLVGPDGDLALAEAKGIGGHVRRANVNQVDDHRDVNEFDPEAMPGLLIVNVFRNAVGDDAAQRELPVSPDVIVHAARNNVLILRTRDLFYLLHRKMAGEDAGQELLTALQAGGGWLTVDERAAELKTS